MTSSLSMSNWSNDYLGIPWALHGSSRRGCSCLGLRNLVYAEQLNIELPDYGDTVDVLEREEILYLLRGECLQYWHEIEPREATEFDVVTFRLRRIESHLGIVVFREHMLHVTQGATSCIVRYTTEDWRTLRPRFYRYSKRPNLLAHPSSAILRGPYIVRDLLGCDGLAVGSKSGLDGAVIIPEGATLLDAVKEAFPRIPMNALQDIRITIGNDVILQEYWHLVKPKKWDRVIIRVVPHVSGLLRIVLTLAVIVGAAAISGGLLGPIAGAVGAAGWLGSGTVSAAIAGAAFAIGGSLLINALIPVHKPTDQNLPDIPTYNISGFTNQLNQDGPVPSVLGQLRWAPPFAALPYTFNYGDFRYAVALFMIGYGPVSISDIWIGNTPITNYQGVTVEIREGYSTDLPVTIYPTQVIEDADNPLDLRADIGGQIRISAVNITSFEVEIFFPTGLIEYDVNANLVVGTVSFGIAWKLVGTSTFTGSAFTIASTTTRPFWRSFRFDVGVRGQYQVQLIRTTADLDDVHFQGSTRFVTKSTWSALRSFRPEYPLNYKKPMALVAIRMQASWQLGGTIQNVSMMCRRVCTDWDTPSQNWVTRATSNPVALARYVWQGPENAFPKTDDQLDIEDLEDWGDYCFSQGLHFDNVYIGDNSQDQVLDDVCAAGRALRHDRGDKQSVIVDSPRTQFTGHITPANSSDFSLVNPKVLFPDAFSVSFLDMTNNYNPTKRIVPWPGFVGVPEIVQELTIVGKVNPTEVWSTVRRRQHEAEKRQNAASVTMDAEQMTSTRGSAVRVNHYVVKNSQCAGYVVYVSADGRTVRTDALFDLQVEAVYQVRFRHTDGTTTIATPIPRDANTSTLTFNANAGAQVGDLVMLGFLATAESEWIIKGIEMADSGASDPTFAANLKLIPSAPELDNLTNLDVPPPWDGIIGNDAIVGIPLAPTTPTFSVTSGAGASSYVTTANPHPVVVTFFLASGVEPVTSLQLQYKLHSSSTWIVNPAIPAATGLDVISGFAVGDQVDIQVRAINVTAASAWSSTTTHTVIA